jgi:hypothetical protein
MAFAQATVRPAERPSEGMPYVAAGVNEATGGRAARRWGQPGRNRAGTCFLRGQVFDAAHFADDGP